MKRICLTLISVCLAWLSSAQTREEMYLRGVSDIMKGDFTSAVDNLTLALNRGGTDHMILMKRGEARFNLNEVDPAIRDFSEANALLPDVADLWLARCYAEKGEEVTAISWLERHLRSDFRLPEERIKRDPAFDALQITEDWFLLWQQDWYTEEEKVLQEASDERVRGRDQDALDAVESAFARGIAGPATFAMRGMINLDDGNFGTAISDFTAAIEGDRNNVQYYLSRGSANTGAERYREAVSDFSRALADEPELFEAYLMRAQAYAGMRSYDQAIADANTYLRYFASDQHAIFLCGEYHFQKGDYLKALEYFNANMKSDPHSAVYFKARGKTYAMTRTYQYAIYDLSMSLDLDPSDGETWLYLGIAKLETGNRTAACSDFEKAQRLGETRALEYMVNNCQ